MDLVQQLHIIEQIKTVKARYFRGLDLKDRDILLTVFTDQVTFDFSEAMHDPITGYKPSEPGQSVTFAKEVAVNAILTTMKDVLSVHQGSCPEIEIIDEYNVTAIWPMHDKVFYKEPTEYKETEGYGYYYDSYKYENNNWKISSTRLSRLWVNISR